jgi:hypothetical protein
LIVFNSTTANDSMATSAYQKRLQPRRHCQRRRESNRITFSNPAHSRRNTPYVFQPSSPPICGLIVPVEFTGITPNFWHYDSSTTNRHNLNSYDLWAEFSIGSKNGKPTIITNGNW